MKQLFACLIVALLTTACDRNGGGGNPTDPSQVNVEFSFTDLTVGTGTQVVAGSRATFLYEVWTYNPAGAASKGNRVQGSTDVVNGVMVGALTYPIGVGQLITGVDQGMIGMRVGGKRRLYIPPNMAYGPQGTSDGKILPNASIVFEVELTAVQ